MVTNRYQRASSCTHTQLAVVEQTANGGGNGRTSLARSGYAEELEAAVNAQIKYRGGVCADLCADLCGVRVFETLAYSCLYAHVFVYASMY